MKAKDVRFARITSECPEQYYAYDADGRRIGYVRVRWGWCKAWCPDEASNEIVYEARLARGWWSFGNKWERWRHLRMARAAIAAWCNAQRAAERDARPFEAITKAFCDAFRTNDDNSVK